MSRFHSRLSLCQNVIECTSYRNSLKLDQPITNESWVPETGNPPPLITMLALFEALLLIEPPPIHQLLVGSMKLP